MRRGPLLLLATLAAGAVAGGRLVSLRVGERLPTGKRITPPPTTAEVASFPANLALCPDGSRLAVVSQGYRQQLTLLDAESGKIVGKVELNAGLGTLKEGAYFGLRWSGEDSLYLSRGHQGRIVRYAVSPGGAMDAKDVYADTTTGKSVGEKPFLAGFILRATGFDGAPPEVIAARNENPGDAGRGDLTTLAFGRESRPFAKVGGFPLDVAEANGNIFATSERDGVVSVVRPNGRVEDVKVGRNPTHLLPASEGVYVSISGSDTITLLDQATGRVKRSVLLRPTAFRGLPSCTPLGMATDRENLYVALGDLNAVGVVRRGDGKVLGYLPAGWYPTAVAVTPKGRLFVANAKGSRAMNPNADGGYVLNILEGTVGAYDLSAALADLPALTRQVLANAGADRKPTTLMNPGIRQVIYVIKENRTYDNVFGDIAGANGDPKITLFPRAVTPNQHALAERFGILDNFYVAADVSYDGWNWSTSGVANEYLARNVPYNYSGRGRSYDGEGETNGVKVDLKGIPDVAESPGGYIWDAALRAKVTVRDYGMFVGAVEALGAKKPASGDAEERNVPNKRALVGLTDESFRQYDLEYPDSEAFQKLGISAPHKLKRFGKYGSISRFSEWKREFDGYVKRGVLPGLSLVRLPRDHTSGTAAGKSSPRAMVADNDYAVGQLVEAVSNSPFWSSTAIVIVEDDAQAGLDHVDAHRSIALVISPFNRRGAFGKPPVDSTFYNTDSALRTIELLLGIKPMTSFDAMAEPFRVFAPSRVNAEPFAAILPDRAILAEVNGASAYRAKDSTRMISRYQEESAPDMELNDILWRSIKGRSTPLPRRPNDTVGVVGGRGRD